MEDIQLKNQLSMLDRDGLVIIKSLFSETWALQAKQIVKNSLRDIPLSKSLYSIHIHNPFLISNHFLEVFKNETLNQIMQLKVGANYKLRNYVCSSIQIQVDSPDRQNPIGEGWHRDLPFEYKDGSTYTGFCDTYQLVIALDPTDLKNSTRWVLGSHDDSRGCHRPSENHISDLEKKAQFFELEPGDAIIFNDNILHRAGVPSELERYLLFIDFCPWYLMQYFNYKDYIEAIDVEPAIKKIFGAHVNQPEVSTRLSSMLSY